jgi:hypothetical protein
MREMAHIRWSTWDMPPLLAVDADDDAATAAM